MEKKINLNPTNFAVTSLSLLNEARKKNVHHCDFVVKVGEVVLPVHKNILSIRSEFFEGMFRIETQESKSGCVVLKNVDQDCAVKCIDYLYTGEATILEEKIGKFLHVAHMLQLRELCDGIVALLKEGLDSTSFFETKRLANTYDLEDLEETCDKFAEENFASIAEKEMFVELEKDYIELLLSSTNTVDTETIKFDALLKWIHGKPDERNNLFPDLLELICLEEVPPQYYKWLLENEPLVYNSANIQRKFSLAVMRTKPIRKEIMVLYDISSREFYSHEIGTKNNTDSCTKLTTPLGNAGTENVAVVLYGPKLYVLTANGALHAIEYDKLGADWKTLERATCVDRDRPHGAAMNGFIYVIGGSSSQRYDIDKNRWDSIPQRPCNNRHPITYDYNYSLTGNHRTTHSSIVAAKGMIYAIGGQITEQYGQPHGMIYALGGQITEQYGQQHGIANVDIYNPMSSSWSSWVNMNQGRYSVAVSAKGSDPAVLYAIGGYYTAQQALGNVECALLGTASNRWTNLTNLPNVFNSLSACVADGKVYVVGTTASRQTQLYSYVPETQEWVISEIASGHQWSSQVAICLGPKQ